MAIDIQNLARQEATATIEFQGEEFDVTYRPNVVTTKWIKSMRKAEKAQDEDIMVKELTKLIVDWELEDGGEPLPVSNETFDELPLPLTSAIIRGVMRSATAGQTEEGKAS